MVHDCIIVVIFFMDEQTKVPRCLVTCTDNLWLTSAMKVMYGENTEIGVINYIQGDEG